MGGLIRIALVTPYPKDPARVGGGVSGAAKYLVDELRKTPGVETCVIVPKQGVGATVREERDGVTVYRVGMLRGWSLLPGTLYDLCVGRRQIRRLLESVRPDVVHFQAAALLAAGCPWPAVLTVHGLVERDALFDRSWGPLRLVRWLVLKLIEGHGRRRSPHVILVSDYAGRCLPPRPVGGRTWRINNPIDGSFFDVRGRARPGRILCCSRVQRIKNITGLIDAFGDVLRAHPQAELRVAGKPDPEYLLECERRACSLGLGAKVRFLGGLSVAEVQGELSKAACLALPSFQENAPLAIAEAMAAGVPVVASNVGGIPEMVEHGRSGFVVDPFDAKELAAALTAVLSDRRRAAAMGRRGRAIAAARFRPSVVCGLTLRAYAEILSGHRAQTDVGPMS